MKRPDRRVAIGSGILLAAVIGWAWYVLTYERTTDFSILNQTGGPMSDVVISFAREGNYRVLQAWPRMDAKVDREAGRRSVGPLADGESRRFAVPRSWVSMVRITYRDEGGRRQVSTGEFSSSFGGGSLARLTVFMRRDEDFRRAHESKAGSFDSFRLEFRRWFSFLCGALAL